MAARVSKLGYIEFAAPDPDRMVEYYTTCLGFHVVERSPAEAYLTTGVDHRSMVIRKVGRRPPPRSGTRSPIDRRRAGAPRRRRSRSSRRSDIAPSTPDVLVLAEPAPTCRCTCTAQEASGAGRVPALQPTKLGHVAASARPEADPGLLPGPARLPVVGHHRRLLRVPALQRRPPRGELPGEREALPGMHHVAYEMRDLDHLTTTLDHLACTTTACTGARGGTGRATTSSPTTATPTARRRAVHADRSHVDEANGYFGASLARGRPQVRSLEVDIATANAWAPSCRSPGPLSDGGS